jgi:hypothetical protein
LKTLGGVHEIDTKKQFKNFGKGRLQKKKNFKKQAGGRSQDKK